VSSIIKKRWSTEIKEKARKLRNEGYSFGRLTKEMGISRSTLHSWVGDIKRSKKWIRSDRIRWMKEIQPLTVLANKKKKQERIKKLEFQVNKEMGKVKFSKTQLRVILSMLYWAEGAKTDRAVTFANTDPKLCLLFITLLRKGFLIDEEKLRVRLYLHYYHNQKNSKKFWSKLLSIPISQFQRTYIKPRSKVKRFRKNFGGICFIRYYSAALKDEIMQLAFATSDKIVGDKKLS